MNELYCPFCGELLNKHIAQSAGRISPALGDILVCKHCTHASTMTTHGLEKLDFSTLTPLELMAVSQAQLQVKGRCRS